MAVYKVKYIVIVEDAEGNYIDHANGRDFFYDTEKEAIEFANDMNAIPESNANSLSESEANKIFNCVQRALEISKEVQNKI